MIPVLITNSQDLQRNLQETSGSASLFWIIEYSQNELNCDLDTYKTTPNRYSLFRNECLSHPQNFKQRLDNGQYRIWTTIPYDIQW